MTMNSGFEKSSGFRRKITIALLGALAALALVVVPAHAATGPVYDVKAVWGDTNLPPGGNAQFDVQVRNVGEGAGNEDLTLTDQLPAGVTVTSFSWSAYFGDLSSNCSGIGTSTVTCVLPKSQVGQVLAPPGFEHEAFQSYPTGYTGMLVIEVSVDPSATGEGTNVAMVSGGGDPSTHEDIDHMQFSSTPASFGLVPGSYEADVFDRVFPFGAPSRQAGDHPFEQRVNFDLNAELGGSEVSSHELVKTVEVSLPQGSIGNPEATPKCSPADFARIGTNLSTTACPTDTQVGYLNIPLTGQNYGPVGMGFASRVAIYNLVPPKGTSADFAFNAGGFVQAHIYANPDPGQNYAIKTTTPNISALEIIRGSEVTFWGVPGDPAHDKFRYYTEPLHTGETGEFGEIVNDLGAPWGSAPIRPFLTDPMDCGFDNGAAKIRVDSYSHPGEFTPIEEGKDPLDVSGCDDPRFRFEPEIALQPSDLHAGAPTGLDVHLKVPQRNDEAQNAKELYAEEGFVKGISTPPMKRAVVTFPEGMTLSASAAQGLGSCTPAQIGLGTNSPVTCPDNSQYGTLILHTPLLPQNAQPEGFIYIAKQGDNPFHNFLSIYLVIEEPNRGILVKVPGRLDLDPKTGQITTTFDDLPQLPVSDMQMTFKGGARAGLVEPSTCGTKTIKAEFFTWQDPSTPHLVKSTYDVTQKPDGSPCVNNLAERQFKPSMEAGTVNPIAGQYSPFVFHLTRGDDDQEFSQLGVKLPEGLAAKFAGVAICSDGAIAQALSRETIAGDGALEQADPSCPASAQIGTTEVGTGVGVPLTYVPGEVYLAGPYKGAPLSMVVISPAVVGPYDLGVITVRTALEIDPETAQGEAVSDPFPQIFQGIPVRIRDIRLNLDRSKFTFNPTSCAQKQITAHVTGTGGDLTSTADDSGADLTNRFQAADCASLGFAPKLAFHLFGGTKRGAHPKFQAVLKARPGDANIAATSVALPHSEFLDQAHIKTVCTRVQFAAHACPAGSVYGYAVAKTPLFDQPLSGPVYLRSSSHQLPDFVAALKGSEAQPVEVVLDGRIDSVNGGIRNTFEFVPDAPVTEFTLTMQGGKKGLLQNSTNLCASTSRATVKFQGQNGKTHNFRPPMQNACSKSRKAKQRKGR
jgi:uncharacterized repeat protein (TIGR01451 family)